MFTSIDHLVIAVADLPQAIEAYTRLGFHTFDGGTNEGIGTRSAIIFHDTQYLELVGIEDAAQHAAAASHDATADVGLGAYICAGGGIRSIALASDDLAADVAAIRARGVEVSEPTRHARTTLGGQRLEWLAAVPLGEQALPLLFVQHLDDLDTRQRQVPQRAPHPNSVFEMERIYIAGTNIAQMVEAYGRVVGGPPPATQDGIIIKADMAMFTFGIGPIVVAQPYGPGPTQDALAARGPGPFQVIQRSNDIVATGEWMTGHGITPAAGGRRANGELVLIVGPADAHGCNMGFVGRDA